MLELDVLDAKLAAARLRREKREAAAAADRKLRDDVEDLKRRGLLLAEAVLAQREKIRALRAEVQALRVEIQDARGHVATPKPINHRSRRRDGLDAELERGLYSD